MIAVGVDHVLGQVARAVGDEADARPWDPPGSGGAPERRRAASDPGRRGEVTPARVVGPVPTAGPARPRRLGAVVVPSSSVSRGRRCGVGRPAVAGRGSAARWRAGASGSSGGPTRGAGRRRRRSTGSGRGRARRWSGPCSGPRRGSTAPSGVRTMMSIGESPGARAWTGISSWLVPGCELDDDRGPVGQVDAGGRRRARWRPWPARRARLRRVSGRLPSRAVSVIVWRSGASMAAKRVSRWASTTSASWIRSSVVRATSPDTRSRRSSAATSSTSPVARLA